MKIEEIELDVDTPSRSYTIPKCVICGGTFLWDIVGSGKSICNKKSCYRMYMSYDGMFQRLERLSKKKGGR